MTSLLSLRPSARVTWQGWVVLLLVGALPAWSHAQNREQGARPPQSDARQHQKSSPEVVAAFRPVVAQPSQFTVRLQSEGKDVALGTIVGPDGWILSKASELKGPITVILKDGRSFQARVVGVQEQFDLAMLKIDANNLPTVTWGDSKAALIGYWVASPGVSDDPIGIGNVSVATRAVPVSPFNNPRPSGGGFLGVTMDNAEPGVKIAAIEANSAAEKAGLKVNDVILNIGGESVRDPDGYAVLLQKLESGKEINVRIRRDETSDKDVVVVVMPQGIPGVTVQPSMQGAVIREVSANSAAEKAGIKVRDIIIAAGGQPIKDTNDLMILLQRSRPDQTLAFRVRRGSEELELKAILGRRPANFDRGDFQNRMGSTLSDRRAGFPMILQHDTVLKPQDCGGPLVDLDGNVLGINIARSGRVESYAVPAEAIQPLLADLMSGKLAPTSTTSRVVLPEEQVAAAKAHVSQLEVHKAEIERRLAEARDTLTKAEAALKAQKEAEAKAEAALKAQKAAEAKAKEAEKKANPDK